ncbi:transcriptional enhancer factor TEF-5 isoform X2 [Onychostoma macrolepis]|uniref:transcriptional enhancer factor TEF-5 isoform X2 n=1 Tax=Onychostoma macrolepis TaxID=369639 RepID=UPI00272BA3D0|nr:transcriptional enhancer factor TEF-5 isoform X2 [Onychostoma macrolepis]
MDKAGLDGDAEGVWSPDIEQSFQEALAIYPPCGRRKIILSDEGKMYGRNELIARYIKLRTGKTRTRKQVSSHIQVLARKKMREYQSGIKAMNLVSEMFCSLLCSQSFIRTDTCRRSAFSLRSSVLWLPVSPVSQFGLIDQPLLLFSISVLAYIFICYRRKLGTLQSILKVFYSVSLIDQASKDKALQNIAALSSAQIVSASVMKSQLPPLPQHPYPPPARFWPGPIPGQPGPSQDIKPFAPSPYSTLQPPMPTPISSYEQLPAPHPPSATAVPVWQDRTIASSKLRMLEYSAFMEVQRDPDTYSKHLFVHIAQTNPSYTDPLLEAVDIRQIYDKFPEKKGGLKELYEKGPQNAFFLVKFWADLNSSNVQDGAGSFYGVSSQYSSSENMTVTVSTKVCSFGKQVVEKVETEYARVEGGRYVYRIHRSPMCEYMINFIHKLKHLPEKYMMNSVLENFTILQVVTNRDTQETLLCIAFVFEVSTSDHGAQYHVYRLVKD